MQIPCQSHAKCMQARGCREESDDSIRYNVPAGHTRWRRGRCRLAATAGQSGPREAQKVGGPGLPWIALDRPGSPRSALETLPYIGTRVQCGWCKEWSVARRSSMQTVGCSRQNPSPALAACSDLWSSTSPNQTASQRNKTLETVD